MSESDSFIDEVSEEVRRERLFGALRRYGWIGVVAVLLLVGGAAVNEWRKAQARAEARALGDSVLAALQAPAPEARRAALGAIAAEDGAADIVALLRAAEAVAAEDPGAAADLLRPLAQNPDAAVVYSDLAALKLVLLGGDGVDAATRAQLLERLAAPGAPYALLAREQQALAHAAEGRTEAALEAADALLRETGLTPALARRLVQLIIALGGTPPSGAAG